MQPYFVPYAGYFCLFAAADVLVIYDEAQYPKGGWVNRNRLTKNNGDVEWLTLPMKKMSIDTEIRNMEFGMNAPVDWQGRMRRFKVFQHKPYSQLMTTVSLATGFPSPLKFIMRTLELLRDELGSTCSMALSSELPIDHTLTGVDYVLAVCEYFSANDYINASGGARLYTPPVFEKRNINLRILQPYQGSPLSILERITFEGVEKLREEIIDNVRFI